MTPSANPVRTVAWLVALIIGLLVLAIPAGYAYMGYRHMVGSLESEAQVIALSFNENIVSRNPDLWEFEKVRMDEYLARLMPPGAIESGRILNRERASVAEHGPGLARPFITRTHDLGNGGGVIGQVEISRSLTPLLRDTALIGLTVLPVGLVVLWLLWTVPIRRLRLAEEQNRKQQSITRQIIETIPMRVFWKDKELRYLGCNTAFARDAGRDKPAEVIGDDDFHMGWREEAEFYRADDRKVMDGGRAKLSFDESQTTPTGGRIWLRTSKVPLRNEAGEVIGLLGTYEDITSWKDTEIALRESEERFRLAFENSAIGMALIGPDGRWLRVNATLCKLVGYEEDVLLAKTFLDITHPDDLQTHRENLQRLLDGSSSFHHSEKRYLHRDGHPVWIRLNVSLVRDEQDRPLHFVVQIEDIGERKLAEQEIEKYVAELTRKNEELQALNDKLTQAQSQLLQSEKMASIGVLAAGVAHEINNPVGFIKSNLQTLDKYVADFLKILDAYIRAEERLSTPEPALAEVHRLKQAIDYAYEKEDVAQLLSESREGVDRVVKIVRDLRDFSRVDSQENWREEDLHQGLESTLNVVWNRLKYTCEVKREYGALPQVECLLSQINQVFMNLLVNSAQAIDEHGTITIRTGTRNDLVWIEIADTGKGIAPENLPRIFDPFFTTKPVGQGTGLGLSVSYSIVRKHHGSIEVESKPGSGTAFRIWLPVRQPAPESAGNTAVAA
jgi:PAS domain S-box-containing protein